MAVAFVSLGSATPNAGAGTRSPACPATVNAGDLLLVPWHSDDAAVMSCTGFAQVPGAPSGATYDSGTRRDGFLYKFAAGTEGGTTLSVTGGGATYNECIVMRFTGVGAIGAFGSSDNAVSQALAVLSNGSDEVVAASYDNASNNTAAPGGWTTRLNGNSSFNFYICDRAANVGTTATQSWTANGNTSLGYGTISIILEADAGGPVASYAPLPFDGPGSVGDTDWMWQQRTGVDAPLFADVNVTGVLDVGGALYATVSHTADTVGRLDVAEYLAATVSHNATVAANLPLAAVPYAPVSHDATVAGHLPAGAAPYSPVSHDAVLAGLLELGIFAQTGDPSSNLSTIGLLFAGLTPYATVTHTAAVAGLLPAGVAPYAPASHDAALTGHLPLAVAPYGPAAHNAVVAGLLEAGAILLNGPSFDYNVAGWLPIGIAPRATVTADRVVAGHLPVAVSVQSTITTTRAAVGLLTWAALPSGLITRTVSIVGYLPSGLVLVGTGASGIVATDAEIAAVYRELGYAEAFRDLSRADGYRERAWFETFQDETRAQPYRDPTRGAP